MNKLLSIALFFASTISTFAQTAPPAKINFQAAVRNSSGLPLTNKTIAVQFKIKSGSVTGIDELVETYTNITTNSYGLFSLAIGTQSISSGGTTLEKLAWGSKDYFLVVSVDTNNTTSGFNVISSQQLITVPYAFHSATADSLINFSLQKDAWTTKGNNALPGHYFGTNNSQDLVIRTNGLERMRILANGSLSFPDASNSISGSSNAIFGVSNNLNNGSQQNHVVGSNNKFLGNSSSNTHVFGNSNNITAGASFGTVIGHNATLAHSGSMVLKDNSSLFLTSTNSDQFSSKFKGGYRLWVDSPAVTVYTPGGNWGINELAPTSSLYVNGSIGAKVDVISTAATLSDMQAIILIKNGGQTITLPNANGAVGRIYILKCPTGLTYSLKPSSGEKLDGSLNATIPFSTSLLIISDGVEWYTMQF